MGEIGRKIESALGNMRKANFVYVQSSPCRFSFKTHSLLGMTFAPPIVTEFGNLVFLTDHIFHPIGVHSTPA